MICPPQRLPCVRGAGKNLRFLTEGLTLKNTAIGDTIVDRQMKQNPCHIMFGGMGMQPKYSNKQLVPLARKLRKDMTKEERHLWYDYLRSYPIRFSRQKVLGKYIVDFYCAQAKLVIELDGSQHYEAVNAQKDDERTRFLSGYGLTVIRIPNNMVNQNFGGVCEYIDGAVRQSFSESSKNFPE